MTFDEALRQLTAGRKAKRLHSLLPAIEQKLAEGVSHKAILGLLNDNGFELTERTYKSYLYRYRKHRRTSGQTPIAANVIGQLTFPAADAARANAAPSSVEPDSRPPTFDFNPHGIPDLLK